MQTIQDADLTTKESCCSRILNYLTDDNKIVTDFDDPNDKKDEKRIIKILVLGPGDSGKSTILKQMRIIHGTNYSLDERRKYKPLIIHNIVDSIIRLVDALKLFSLKFSDRLNEDNYLEILNCHEKLQIDLSDWNRNSDKYCTIIKQIWDDHSIRVCYSRRNKFYLIDSIE